MSRTIALIGLVIVAVGVAGYVLYKRQEPPSYRVFVSNYRDDTISVIDGRVDREEKVIEVGGGPSGIDAQRKNLLVAVANETASQVTLIDGDSLKIAGTIPTALAPEDVVFSKDGDLLYVTFPREAQVGIYDVAKRGALGEPIPLSPRPLRLALAPDGKRLYVLLAGKKGAVAVMDTASREVAATIPVGPAPTDLALSGDGRRLLTTSFDDDTVTVIDTEKLAPVATYKVTTGEALMVHPSRHIAYSMASFDSDVHVFDYDNGKILKTFSYGEWPTHSAFTDDGRFLYVVHEESQNVVKVDTETNEELLRIAVGKQPGDAVILPRP